MNRTMEVGGSNIEVIEEQPNETEDLREQFNDNLMPKVDLIGNG